MKLNPFKNDGQRNEWKVRNCNSCSHSFKPEIAANYGIDQMVKMSAKGIECPLKVAIEEGIYQGGIEAYSADRIGFEENYVPIYCKCFKPQKMGKNKRFGLVSRIKTLFSSRG